MNNFRLESDLENTDSENRYQKEHLHLERGLFWLGRERFELLEGEMTIDSQPGVGTLIQYKIPIILKN
ncbi:hypothetical protein C6W19_21630 [Bacillus sp. RJGP41]|nr:hypothetical protein C6W19_21630 [Bacillus sp. RJGP41]